ncbi:hypothetical protein [Cryptosporangium minutisporangium]|uniref:DUF1328 domain-containing protein n=1 Tax=Cryptosporangium minutisporangium TaxID=113569 RepID=A0ABP6T9W2_9ACTN
MKFILVLLALLGIAIGAFGVVYGEADDSPGLQLLGVLIVAGTLVFGIRTLRRSR